MLIELAFFMMKAASSALPTLTARSRSAPAAIRPLSVPKPPRITLKIERFITCT